MIRLLERLGVPRVLMLGFLAVAIFMTGDGFELTFLSKFMVDQGFTSSQASLLVTVYGLFAAAGGWSAGVLAEMFGARRVMMFGAYWWIGIHLLFLGVAIPSRIYPLILGLCALRGIGYPLFIYSFVVLMAQYISPSRLASATGFHDSSAGHRVWRRVLDVCGAVCAGIRADVVHPATAARIRRAWPSDR